MSSEHPASNPTLNSNQNSVDNISYDTYSAEDKEQIKLLEIAHLVGNVASGGVLSSLFVAAFLLLKKDVTPNVKAVAYDIINFNLSFLIYISISAVLVLVLIGILGLIVFGIAWFVLMILGAVKHFSGERYEYPMTIRFLK